MRFGPQSLRRTEPEAAHGLRLCPGKGRGLGPRSGDPWVASDEVQKTVALGMKLEASTSVQP